MKTGVSIPTISLNEDVRRHVVIDRERGQYLGHPTTAKLADGKTVYAVYPKGHGKGPLILKRSDDEGRTWSERLPVPESWSTSMEVPTIYRTVGPDGKGHLIIFSSLYPIQMTHSEDDGRTWSELEPIGDFGGVVGMGDLVSRGNGEYVAYFHDHEQYLHPDGSSRTEVYVTGKPGDGFSRVVFSSADGRGDWVPKEVWNSCDTARELPGSAWTKRFETLGGTENCSRESTWYVYAVRSFDGGLTWSEPRPVVSLPGVWLCEPGIVRSPDGKRLAMLLRENSRRYNSHVCFSDDQGLTWTEPVPMPPALTGDRHQALTLPDGRILVSFRDMLDASPTQGSWVGWVGSFDDLETGGEGRYRILFKKNYSHDNFSFDCAYPALERFDDGTILAATYGHWTEGEKAWILGMRFTMEELDKLAKEAGAAL